MSGASIVITKQHITLTSGICGGKPCITGTRIRVQDIYIWHELQSQSVDEIVAKFPQLTHGDVYAALSYFWDNRVELMAEIQRGDSLVENFKLKHPSKLSAKPKGPHDDEDIAVLKAKLERGAGQAERGELIDGKQVFEEIRRVSADHRESAT